MVVLVAVTSVDETGNAQVVGLEKLRGLHQSVEGVVSHPSGSVFEQHAQLGIQCWHLAKHHVRHHVWFHRHQGSLKLQAHVRLDYESLV